MNSTYSNGGVRTQDTSPKAKSKIVKTYHHSINVSYGTLLSRGDLRLNSDSDEAHEIMSSMMADAASNGSGDVMSHDSMINKYSFGGQSIVDSGMASRESLLPRDDRGLSQSSLLTTASTRGEFDPINRANLLDSHIKSSRKSLNQIRGKSPCRTTGHGVKQMINFFEGSPTHSNSEGSTPKHSHSSRSQSKDRAPSPLTNGHSPLHSKVDSKGRSSSPSDRKDSAIHLSCVASGYGKYSPYSQRKNHNTCSNGNELAIAATKTEEPATKTVFEDESITVSHSANTDIDSATNGLNSDDIEITLDISNGVNEGKQDLTDILQGDEVDRARVPGHISEDITRNGEIPNGSIQNKNNSCDMNNSVHDSPSKKGGEWFLKITDDAQTRLLCQCDKAQSYLDDENLTLTDEVSGQIRATIGKAHLLVNKKFKQFRGLCHKNLTQEADEQFPTTTQDLAGFWDMVMIQVDDVIQSFHDISELKSNGWSKVEKNAARNNNVAPQSSKSGKINKQCKKTPDKSAATKARDELRKQRLMAAKRAMRERRNSQEAADDVIIISAPEH